MEYSPTGGVQFWAYGSTGAYLPQASLDSQGPKPLPDICLACHLGFYSGAAGDKVNGATFLAFDLDSFLDESGTPFPASHTVTRELQQQFHLLNNMVLGTKPPPGTTQVVQLWYPGGASPAVPFTFNQGAAKLSGAPFSGHEALYDNVVKVSCRSCHVAIKGVEWNSFSQMSNLATIIQSLSCAPSLMMPHAEVPWKDFWQQGLQATLAYQLNFGPPGCQP
jgi:hypothetical protein